MAEVKYESSMMNVKVIDRFKGEYAYLSNFYWETSGTTVEHRFQAAKAKRHPEHRVKILNAKSAGEAKRLGRAVPMSLKWWHGKRDNAMYQALLVKYFDPNLREKLLSTEDALIIEGNYHHDNYWGNCMCSKCKHTLGHNHLGLMLMEVRTHYREYEEHIDDIPYQTCAEPECDANTEGNRPYCTNHTRGDQLEDTDIDGAQMAHNEKEDSDG